jgi:hypothetical protein
VLAERRPGVADPQLGQRLGRDPVQVRDLVQHPTRAFEHLGAHGRERDVPRRTLQQPHTERRLQRGDRTGHRRLCEVEFRCRIGERAGVDHRHERPQVPQIHAFSV